MRDGRAVIVQQSVPQCLRTTQLPIGLTIGIVDHLFWQGLFVSPHLDWRYEFSYLLC